MSSTSETGHVKNVANFYDQISFITGYGPTYNPNKASITLAGLTAKHTEGLNALESVTGAYVTYTNAVNNRLIPFQGIPTLASRIVNALDATDASTELVNDAKVLLRKLRGRRATSAQPINPGDPIPVTISVSQLSYDQLLEHFTNLVALATSEPSYSPNEVELQGVTLNALINTLRSLNNAVADAWTTISNSRLERNNVLYHENDGLLAIAQESKNYTRSVFGPQAPQTKQLTGIRYHKIKS